MREENSGMWEGNRLRMVRGEAGEHLDRLRVKHETK